jgi:hypothetical protein
MSNIDYTALINGEEETIEESITPQLAKSTDEGHWEVADDHLYSYSNIYYDPNYSEIDEDKTIKIDPHQINLTQEGNSQYIPF